MAKITTLLQNVGRHEGTQLLSATKLAEALYRSGTTVGLSNRALRNRFGEGRYHLSFWSVPYRTSGGCFFQIPYMAGFGGNLVALLPNGVSVFRFADGMNYDLDAMILAGESIRPFCPPPGTAAAPEPARVPLTTGDLAIPGHTFAFGAQHLFFAPDGRLYGAVHKDDADLGRWTIGADARVCRAWTKWDHALPRCFAIYREGESYAFEVPERFSRAVSRRTPGGLEP